MLLVLCTVQATCFVIIPVEKLGTWEAVVPLYMCYGVGRGVWESVNKVCSMVSCLHTTSWQQQPLYLFLL